MSTLNDTKYFGVADLPSPDLLGLHVTPDFLSVVHEGQVLAIAIEALAAEYHEQHRKTLNRARPKTGLGTRGRAPGCSPTFRYSDLSEVDKEEFRMLARLLPAKLLDLGYRILPRAMVAAGESRRLKLSRVELRHLQRVEHDIWLRTHLLRGFDWGARSRENLLLHKNVLAFDKKRDQGDGLDITVVENISNVLWKNGYTLVKVSGGAGN